MTPYEAALLAEEAYTAKPDIGLPESASRAIVRPQADGSVVIAFPGTDNHESFFADIDVLTIEAPVGEVHRGFWLAWQAISSQIEEAIGERSVTFIGHSLGAALALLAAKNQELVGKPVSYVYGFEPPRVSPHSFSLNCPVYLTRKGRDAVTQVPLGWPGMALTQIGHPLLLVDNLEDHRLAGVIAALAPANAAVA